MTGPGRERKWSKKGRLRGRERGAAAGKIASPRKYSPGRVRRIPQGSLRRITEIFRVLSIRGPAVSVCFFAGPFPFHLARSPLLLVVSPAVVPNYSNATLGAARKRPDRRTVSSAISFVPAIRCTYRTVADRSIINVGARINRHNDRRSRIRARRFLL